MWDQCARGVVSWMAYGGGSMEGEERETKDRVTSVFHGSKERDIASHPLTADLTDGCMEP